MEEARRVQLQKLRDRKLAERQGEASRMLTRRRLLLHPSCPVLSPIPMAVDARPDVDGKRPVTDWKGLIEGCPQTVPRVLHGHLSIDAKHLPVRETDLFVRRDDDGDRDAHDAFIQYRLWCLAVRTGQYACAVTMCPVAASGQWHRRHLPLLVYRVNGEPWDDRLANLRLLCPNCHHVASAAQREGKTLTLPLHVLKPDSLDSPNIDPPGRTLPNIHIAPLPP
jgi:hypothetical protein